MAMNERWYRQHARVRKRIRQTNSRLVHVWRNDSLVFSAMATVYELRMNELIDYGTSLDARRRDYLFTLSDIPIGYQPIKGDVIKDDEGETSAVVLPHDEATARWTSADRKSIRVHTKVEAYTIPGLVYATLESTSEIGSVVVQTGSALLRAIESQGSVGVVVVSADLVEIVSEGEVGLLEEVFDPEAVPV